MLLRPAGIGSDEDVRIHRRRHSVQITTPERGERLLDDLHVFLRHRLLPLSGKAFGGSAGLVDVAVAGDAHDYAVHPCADLCEGDFSHLTRAARGTALLGKHGKRDSVSEIENLLRLLLGAYL